MVFFNRAPAGRPGRHQEGAGHEVRESLRECGRNERPDRNRGPAINAYVHFIHIHYIHYSNDRVAPPAELSIAGTSTEFVNRILEKVKAGIPSGGLEEI